VAEKEVACDRADLLAFCRREAVTTLVLVNPANPTGGFLAAGEVAALAEELGAMGTRLVLDESFVDFVDGTPDHGLAREELLERCPSLIVVKSISKSYGVPGLRLGVLASGDRALVDRVQARIPIWNINSIAEYFLQLVGKYERAYWASCRQVADERAWLSDALAGLGFLRPLPSGANYLLCEVTDGRTGRELAERLLADDWILIKDLGRKRGLERGEFIRLAVRSRAENLRLLAGLARPARNATAAGTSRPGSVAPA
jgi:histidinol-phosphate/aromatic aminotransferase/cobyric acid decarboxylase-like protein